MRIFCCCWFSYIHLFSFNIFVCVVCYLILKAHIKSLFSIFMRVHLTREKQFVKKIARSRALTLINLIYTVRVLCNVCYVCVCCSKYCYRLSPIWKQKKNNINIYNKGFRFLYFFFFWFVIFKRGEDSNARARSDQHTHRT